MDTAVDAAWILPNDYGLCKISGNLAIFTAICRASSRVSNLAADLHANVSAMAFANLICIKPISQCVDMILVGSWVYK